MSIVARHSLGRTNRKLISSRGPVSLGVAASRYAERSGVNGLPAGWVVRLAGAQVRHRPTRWALLALGVALTAAIPVVSLGSARVASGQTVRHTLSQLAPGDRAITVIAQRPVSATEGDPATDRFIDGQFDRLSSAPTRRELIFRQLDVLGNTFFLAGTDRLAAGVRVVEGRLPTSCTPLRCEVILVGAGSLADFRRAVVTIGLVVVGRGERADPTLVSGPFDIGNTPLLVAAGVNEVAKLDALSLFGRSYAWVRAVDADRVVRLGVPAYVARSGRVAQDIADRIASSSVERPDQELTVQDDRARISSRRFGLLGGTAAALLIGFAILAAIGLRTEHGQLLDVLRRRGATRADLIGLTAVRAASCCLVGAALGFGIGAIAVVLLAGRAGVPIGAALAHATGSGAAGVAVLVAAAAIAVTAVLCWPTSGGRRLWAILDVVAVGALAAALLAGSRGSTSTATLAAGSDPLVTVLPVLAAVTGGLVAARLLVPFARLTERLVPRRATAARIALFGAVRRPLRPVATAAFLTAAIAAVVFAGAYRATLLAGAGDQAAYQVPLDVRLVAAADGTSPLEVTGSAPLAAVAPGVRTYGVVRGTGSVHTADGAVSAATLVGVDAAALATARRFGRTSGAAISGGDLGRRLRSAAPAPGPTLPSGTRRVRLAVSGANSNLALTLTLAGPDGLEHGVPLTLVAGGLAATVPVSSEPQHVVAISVRESDDYSTHHLHNVGEGSGDQPLLQGVLSFAAVTADDVTVAWDWSNWASVLGRVEASAATLALTYRLAGTTVVATPSAAPARLLVATDPVTAERAVNGVLPLFIDSRSVPARIVAVVPRLPTVSGAFVLTLRAPLVAVLDATQPGAGSVRELWVAAPGSSERTLERAVTRAPLAGLGVSVRAAIERGLAADPVGRGSRQLLVLVAALALLAAGAAIVLLVVGERRDGAGELYAWEADGVRPSVLRRTIFLRAVIVLVVGLPLGLVTGLVLAVAGARLVVVDAVGMTPAPPVQTAVGGWWSVGVLAGVLAAAMALAAAVCAGALRS